jgi:hypothetical protein
LLTLEKWHGASPKEEVITVELNGGSFKKV